MKVTKNGVIKDIKNEKDLGDYIDAGWKPYVEPKKKEEKLKQKGGIQHETSDVRQRGYRTRRL